jgi:hypothetical protein
MSASIDLLEVSLLKDGLGAGEALAGGVTEGTGVLAVED